MKENINLLLLLKKAKKIQKNAYAPYSLFKVAAIVNLKNKKKILGVNVENASYSVTICAERTALSQVVTQGYKKEDIISLFLITNSEKIITPCGLCRQFMIETMPEKCPIFLSNQNKNNDVKKIYKMLIKDLLPLAFKYDSIKIKG